jgi:phosphopantothenoylcysteine synthetase/decarboxylase
LLYVVVCAASAADGVGALVSRAVGDGWRVAVITSPLGRRFVDVEALGEVTGERVRSEFRSPEEPKELPLPDAVVVAPATFNTLNKWAAGIADTYAVAVLCEAVGLRVPVVAVPVVNGPFARHPAYGTSLAALRGMGVQIVEQPEAGGLPDWASIAARLAD